MLFCTSDTGFANGICCITVTTSDPGNPSHIINISGGKNYLFVTLYDISN